MEAAEPSPVWCSQVCLGRPGGLFSLVRQRAYLGTASIGTLEALEGISSRDTATVSRAPINTIGLNSYIIRMDPVNVPAKFDVRSFTRS